MKRFAKRVMLYALPVGILIGFFEFVMWSNLELTPITQVVDAQIQAEEEVYYLRKYLSTNPNTYKLGMMKQVKPAVLIMGTSRVMQFRNFLFSPYEASFYNTGGATQNMADILSLIDQIQKGKLPRPRLLVLGLDFWMLKKEAQASDTWLRADRLRDDASNYGQHLVQMRDFLIKCVQGDLPEFSEGRSGFGAYGKRGEGFRKDGSMHYRTYIQEYLANPVYRDRESPNILSRIANQSLQFSLPFGLDSSKINGLIHSLSALQDQGTEVLVYFPPLSKPCYEALVQSKPHNEGWRQYLQLSAQLSQRGIFTIPSIYPEQIGLDDRYMLDGFHPSEVMVGTQWLQFLQQHPRRAGILSEFSPTAVSALLQAPRVIPLSFMQDNSVLYQ